jgi:uncharacterized delta-60 repeat protein
MAAGSSSASAGTLSRAVHVQPDGRILVLGAAGDSRRSLYPAPGQFGLVRLLPDGSRDRSFGTNGFVAWNPPWRADTQNLFSLPGVFVQQGSGRVLGAGIVDEVRWLGAPFASPNVQLRRVAFVRFNEDGSVDESFGHAGVIEGPEGPDLFQEWAALLDGRVVALSSRTDEAGSASWWLHRYTADGVVDGAFGSDGSVRLDLKDLYDVRDLVPAPNGGLVILRKRALRRIRPGGQLDAGFGTACGRPRVPAFSYAGAASTSGRGVFASGTTYVIRRRQDSLFVLYGSDGCVASRPLRLRGRYYSGPPTLQGRHGALVGASFDSGLALIRLRRGN